VANDPNSKLQRYWLANRALLKLRHREVRPLLERLRGAANGG